MGNVSNTIKYRKIKSDLKKAFQYDLRKWDRVNECLDRKKYRCVHLYLKQFNYSLQSICDTSIRFHLPYSVSEIVERTNTQDQRFAYHEVQYQILCAELYLVVSTFERHDNINSLLSYSEQRKIKQKCWTVTKELFDSYHEGIDKFKGIPEHKIIASTMMSCPFNFAIFDMYFFLKEQIDIDTRNLDQKITDSTKSIIVNILFFAVKIIFLALVVFLMAKCCEKL